MPRLSSLPARAAAISALALAVGIGSRATAAPAPAAPSASSPTPAPSTTATPSPPAPATYSVNISPLWKVGQKFGYVADDVSTSSDGNSNIHFEADGEVLALLPSGNPQKIAYTVKTLSVTGTDLAQGNFPHPDSVIVVEFAPNNKRSVTLYDHPLDSEVADTLEDVLWITWRNHPDQEIFGPAQPVAVGASWPINAKAFLDTHEEGDPLVTSVEGSLTLQSVDGAGDNHLAVVTGNIIDKGQNPPDDPGSFVDQSKFTVSFPLNRHGAFKETFQSNITTTPPASPLDFIKKNTNTTSQETITQEVTLN